MHGPDSDADKQSAGWPTAGPHVSGDAPMGAAGDGANTGKRRFYLGRHRDDDLAPDSTRGRGLAWPIPVALIVAVLALSGLGYVINNVYRGQPTVPAAVDEAALDRSEPAARSLDRGATSDSSPTPTPDPTLTPSPSPSATAPSQSPSAAGATGKPRARTTTKASVSPKPSPTRSTPPAPVGGLTQQQMNNAATIVKVGQQRNMPKRAYVIAIATALQESYLRNLANGNVPQSLSVPNEGLGYDHDSVGLFQQRPSTGWGTVTQCMTPSYSAGMFYQRLALVGGWESMSLAAAAQAVQISAFPDAYAKHEPLANQIVAALT